MRAKHAEARVIRNPEPIRARGCVRAVVATLVLAAVAAHQAVAVALPPPPPASLWLIPDDMPLDDAAGATEVHVYPDAKLVSLAQGMVLNARQASRVRRLADPREMHFRAWSGRVEPSDPELIRILPKGRYLLALAGPMDPRWLAELEALGVIVDETGWPYTLAVEADGPALSRALRLTTSAGYRLVLSVVTMPLEARISPEIDGASSPGEPDKNAAPVRLRLTARQDGVVRSLKAGSAELLKSCPDCREDEIAIAVSDLAELLEQYPAIDYVEPAARIELHNNLAATGRMLAVEPVWNELDYIGRGVIVNHNDSGVDLEHADLPPEAVVATVGYMEFTNNAHGTHTAASVLGRGTLPSPVNTSACGDMSEPLPTVRGMAWGAQLASNNIFDGGLGSIENMLIWGSRQGASISTNSWGLYAGLGPLRTYSEGSTTVDAAVRDADPSTPGAQPLAIFFSAGNAGPKEGSVGAPGNGKNTIAVGATQNDRCGTMVPDTEPGPDVDQVTGFSSRGPSQGRIKPDLVAPGADVLSAESTDPEAMLGWDDDWTGDDYSLCSGTSMACPLAAGAGAVFEEFYRSTFGVLPSPAMTKAALVNGAVDTGLGYPSHAQGWGRLDLLRSIKGPPNGSITFIAENDTDELGTGSSWATEIQVFSTVEPLEITLVWTDPPGEAGSEHPLRNDLDLLVISPDGTAYRGNRFLEGWSEPDPGAIGDDANNVEVVLVAQPLAGPWQIQVQAVDVPVPPQGLSGQDFVVVYSGDAAACAPPPPPHAVVGAAVGDNQVELSWPAVDGASAFAIFRAMAPGGRPYELIASVDGAATSFLDTDVSGSITYYYVIRVFTDCWSAFSEEIEVTAEGRCLLAPSFPGLEQVTDLEQASCGLGLQWPVATSSCGGELEYKVYRSRDPQFTPGPANLLADGLRSTQLEDMGLAPGETYYYVVRAVDAGNGATEANRVVHGGTPSGTDWVLVANHVTGNGDGWREGPASELDSGVVHWQVADDTAHSDPWSWSCPDAAQISDRMLSLEQPVHLTADHHVILEFWHRYELEEHWDGARLEVSVDGGATWSDVLGDAGGAVSANPERFLADAYDGVLVGSSNTNPLAGHAAWTGDSRRWKLARVDLDDFVGHELMLRWRLACDSEIDVAGGWWIDDVRLVEETPCHACVGPPPPTGLAATAGSNSVNLSWTPDPSATAIRVHRAARASGPYTVLAELTGTSVAFSDRATSGGTAYAYAVSQRSDCWSALSDPVLVTAAGSCTLAPTFWGLDSLSTTGRASCSLELEWAPATSLCDGGSVSYSVYRSPGSVVVPGPDTLIQSGITEPRYLDAGLPGNGPYSYVVRAVDGISAVTDDNLRMLTGQPTGREHLLLAAQAEAEADELEDRRGSPADDGTSQPWQRVEPSTGSIGWSFFCSGEERIKDRALVTTTPLVLPPSGPLWLEFRQRWDLELGWDGGRLEYSTDDGASWHDILASDGGAVPANPGRIVEGTYESRLGPGVNPLSGELAWTGQSVRWVPTRVDLSELAGQELMVRWRLACDASRTGSGWWVDEIRVLRREPCRRQQDGGSARD